MILKGHGDLVDFLHTKGNVNIFGREFHEYYEFYLLIDGTADYISTKTKQTIKPFRLIVIPPGEYHNFIPRTDIENYERCIINIHSGFLSDEIMQSIVKNKDIIELQESNRIVQNYLYLASALTSVDPNDFSIILPAIATDIVMLIKNSVESSLVSTDSIGTYSEIIKYIDAHYTKHLNLEELSKQFNYSVSSLCSGFKKHFGTTIKKYITQKRMIGAKIDLQKGEPAEKICQKYGFCSYSTFFRCYKKHFGVAPSEHK